MIDTKHSYTGSYIYQNSDFYIHQHAQCIGRAMNGSAMSDGSLAKMLSSQKGTAINAAKNYYQTLFLDNLTLSEDEMKLLKGVFDEDLEEMIRVIDNQVRMQMHDAMDRSTLERLMSLQIDSAKAAKNMLNTNSKQSLQAFNSILNSLADASELIDSPLGVDLAILLRHATYKRNMGIAQMGQKLYDAVEAFAKSAKVLEVNDQRINQVVASLKTMASTLSQGKTASKKKSLTEDNIVDVVDSVFNPGFAEAIASQIKETADMSLENSMTKLTGTKAYFGQLTDSSGKVIGKDNKKAAGKVDFKLENVAVNLKYGPEDSDSMSIDMDIGISNKFYRSLGFPVGKGKTPNLSFSSGSGGTLKEAINAIFNGERDRYLVYNVVGHQASLGESSAALNDLILTRQINRLFATRGGSKDFAQYIFINGEVISIGQLIEYAAGNFIGKSHSQIRKKDDQAISLSIPGRPAILEAVQIREAKERTAQINSLINSTTIAAHIHVNKIIQALSI